MEKLWNFLKCALWKRPLVQYSNGKKCVQLIIKLSIRAMVWMPDYMSGIQVLFSVILLMGSKHQTENLGYFLLFKYRTSQSIFLDESWFLESGIQVVTVLPVPPLSRRAGSPGTWRWSKQWRRSESRLTEHGISVK